RQCRRRPRLDGPLRCPDGHRCRGEQRDERDAPMSLTEALAHNRSTAGTRAARGAVTSATVVSALVLLIAVSWALLPGLFPPHAPAPPRPPAGTRAAPAAVTSATVVSALAPLTAASWALLPGLFTHFDPNDGGDTPALLPPSLDHWFGSKWVNRPGRSAQETA